MPSLLTSLADILNEDYTVLKQNNVADERLKTYNLGQLYGLRRFTQNAIERLPACTLRSSNQLLLERLEEEISKREVILRAQLARKAEEDAREAKEKRDKQFKKKEKEVIIRMHQAYARMAAEKEIRATEEMKMLEEKSKLDIRRVQALKMRSYLYISAVVVGVGGILLYFMIQKVGLVVVIVCMVAMLALFIKGYLKGEEWRMKVVTEQSIKDKIEKRAEELVVGIHAEYKQRLKAEKAAKAVERAERKKKRLEREEKKREEERRIEQQNMKALEDGRLRIMEQMLADKEAEAAARMAEDEEDNYAQELREAKEEEEREALQAMESGEAKNGEVASA